MERRFRDLVGAPMWSPSFFCGYQLLMIEADRAMHRPPWMDARLGQVSWRLRQAYSACRVDWWTPLRTEVLEKQLKEASAWFDKRWDRHQETKAMYNKHHRREFRKMHSVSIDPYTRIYIHICMCVCVCIIYTPNLGLRIAVPGREREQGRFRVYPGCAHQGPLDYWGTG